MEHSQNSFSVLYNSNGKAGMCSLFIPEDKQGILWFLFGSSVVQTESTIKLCKHIRNEFDKNNYYTGTNGLLFMGRKGEDILYIQEGDPKRFKINYQKLIDAIDYWIDWLQRASVAFAAGEDFEGLPNSLPLETASKYKYIGLKKEVNSKKLNYSVYELNSKTNESTSKTYKELFN